MRHKARESKKKKPLKLLTKQNKLHSKNNASYSKSTYFYFSGPFFLKKVSNLQKHLVRFCSEKRDFPNKTDNCMDLERNGHFSTYLLPVVCSMALLLVFGWMVNPTLCEGSKSYALESSDNSDAAVGSDAIVNAKDTTSLGIAWTNPGDLDRETNGMSGEVIYRYDTFTLTGSRIKQYQIFVNAASGSNGQLEGYLDADHTVPISNIGGITNANGVAGRNIPSNEWGYAVSEGYKTDKTELEQLIYKSVPSSSDTMAAFTGTEETLDNKQFTVAFAVNVGNDKPSGHYTAYVTVSAVMEAKEIVALGFAGITTMQEMTSEICNGAAKGTEGRLKDTRDEKFYWVAKLEDGNCWMTQNLDLDLSTGVALTSTKSDVSRWTPEYSTQSTPSGWGGNHAYQKSYNPGDYYYVTPNQQNPCSGGAFVSDGLSSCTNNGWRTNVTNASITGLTDVSSWSATYDEDFVNNSTYTGRDGQSTCYKKEGSMLGDGSRDQCKVYYFMYAYAYEHYHVGNYYSYATATAGSAPVATGVATSSICPRGWTLPTNSGSMSYSELFASYGDYRTNTLMYGTQDIRLAPLYFVYGGYIRQSYLGEVGNSGYYRESMSSGAYNAYYLYFSGDVGPAREAGRDYGYYVRCVAR